MVKPARLAVKAQLVIDGTGRRPIERGVVLVEGGRIAAVGRQAEISIPEGTEVLDCGAQTLLPGLIDAHSHASIIPGLGDQIGQLRQGPAPQLLRAVQNLRADLRSGVTTMRVVGEEHFIDIELRAAIAEGRLPGPRLLVATRPITARNGHGAALTFSDGEDEIRRHVRENVAMGERGTWLVTNNAVSGHPDGIEKGDGGVPSIMAKLKESRERSRQTFQAVLESGVRWALGTDSMHGLMWWEIAKVVEWGADPHDAILAGTRRAAEAIGMGSEAGSLEPGKLADVISVDGNPLADITCLQRVGVILQGGLRRDTLSDQ